MARLEELEGAMIGNQIVQFFCVRKHLVLQQGLVQLGTGSIAGAVGRHFVAYFPSQVTLGTQKRLERSSVIVLNSYNDFLFSKLRAKSELYGEEM